jgi:hypothetical protein
LLLCFFQVTLTVPIRNVGFAASTGNIVFVGYYRIGSLTAQANSMTGITTTFGGAVSANTYAVFYPVFRRPSAQDSSTVFYYAAWSAAYTHACTHTPSSPPSTHPR